EVVNCNGCHLPQAKAQNPRSHGRQGVFASAWAGAAVSGAPFPHSIATGTGAFIPQAGETMAEARMRTSCRLANPPCQQMVPRFGRATLNPAGGMNVLYNDVWTAPAQATPGTPIALRYDDPTQFFTAIPTTALCVTQWAANCRIIINYPQHLQPVWDAPRPNPPVAGVNNTCSQGGCHNAKDAAGAAQPRSHQSPLPGGATGAPLLSAAAVPAQRDGRGCDGHVRSLYECGCGERAAVAAVLRLCHHGCGLHGADRACRVHDRR